MRSNGYIHGFLLSLLLMLGSCAMNDDEVAGTTVGLQPGDEVAEFAVTLSDGSPFTSQSLRGVVGVIVFFNTLCPDCRSELPVVDRLQAEFPDVVFIAIARDEGAESIARFWDDEGLSLPYAPAGAMPYSLFAASGIPRIYVTRSADTAETPRIVAAFSDNPIPSADELRDALLATR